MGGDWIVFKKVGRQHLFNTKSNRLYAQKHIDRRVTYNMNVYGSTGKQRTKKSE
jgi:hypothetical protein